MFGRFVVTLVNSVFFIYGLKVNVFNTDIHFISRRSHITANRQCRVMRYNIIFYIIRLREFFSAGVQFEIEFVLFNTEYRIQKKDSGQPPAEVPCKYTQG